MEPFAVCPGGAPKTAIGVGLPSAAPVGRSSECEGEGTFDSHFASTNSQANTSWNLWVGWWVAINWVSSTWTIASIALRRLHPELWHFQFSPPLVYLPSSAKINMPAILSCRESIATRGVILT